MSQHEEFLNYCPHPIVLKTKTKGSLGLGIVTIGSSGELRLKQKEQKVLGYTKGDEIRLCTKPEFESLYLEKGAPVPDKCNIIVSAIVGDYLEKNPDIYPTGSKMF